LASRWEPPAQAQRKAGIRADDGSVIAFPYMPRVADLPPGWRHFSPADKIKHLLGMPLDRALEIISWPLAGLDPMRVSLKVQVIRIIVLIAGKALLDGSLDCQIVRARERDAALARMVSELASRSKTS
jgi:hypothetical protein